MGRFTTVKGLLFSGCVLATAVGCGQQSSFSILPTSNIFNQSVASTDIHVDLLFVVDNSGSMASSQANLAANFPTFINGFTQKNLDFQIAVTGTDSYAALPAMTPLYNAYNYYHTKAQGDWAKFRDGGLTLSGVYMITPATPNLTSVFVNNVTLGAYGNGDERPFQSLKTALDSSLNAGFVRPNSFLSIVILTDEDDFSNDSYSYLDLQYNNPAVHPVANYVSYLDTLTGSTATHRNYNVHAIAVQDAACRDSLSGGQVIATRVNQLADDTGGIKASICGNFATQLQTIANNILELSTQFYLSRIPVESTIQIIVDGNVVPNAANNPGPLTGGWTYKSVSNSILFSGDYIPVQGAKIQVNFDPVKLGS